MQIEIPVRALVSCNSDSVLDVEFSISPGDPYTGCQEGIWIEEVWVRPGGEFPDRKINAKKLPYRLEREIRKKIEICFDERGKTR